MRQSYTAEQYLTDIEELRRCICYTDEQIKEIIGESITPYEFLYLDSINVVNKRRGIGILLSKEAQYRILKKLPNTAKVDYEVRKFCTTNIEADRFCAFLCATLDAVTCPITNERTKQLLTWLHEVIELEIGPEEEIEG